MRRGAVNVVASALLIALLLPIAPILSTFAGPPSEVAGNVGKAGEKGFGFGVLRAVVVGNYTYLFSTGLIINLTSEVYRGCVGVKSFFFAVPGANDTYVVALGLAVGNCTFTEFELRELIEALKKLAAEAQEENVTLAAQEIIRELVAEVLENATEVPLLSIAFFNSTGIVKVVRDDFGIFANVTTFEEGYRSAVECLVNAVNFTTPALYALNVSLPHAPALYIVTAHLAGMVYHEHEIVKVKIHTDDLDKVIELMQERYPKYIVVIVNPLSGEVYKIVNMHVKAREKVDEIRKKLARFRHINVTEVAARGRVKIDPHMVNVVNVEGNCTLEAPGKVLKYEIRINAGFGTSFVVAAANKTYIEDVVRKHLHNASLVDEPMLIEPLEGSVIEGYVKIRFIVPPEAKLGNITVVRVVNGTVEVVKNFTMVRLENGTVVIEVKTSKLSTWGLVSTNVTAPVVPKKPKIELPKIDMSKFGVRSFAIARVFVAGNVSVVTLNTLDAEAAEVVEPDVKGFVLIVTNETAFKLGVLSAGSVKVHKLRKVLEQLEEHAGDIEECEKYLEMHVHVFKALFNGSLKEYPIEELPTIVNQLIANYSLPSDVAAALRYMKLAQNQFILYLEISTPGASIKKAFARVVVDTENVEKILDEVAKRSHYVIIVLDVTEGKMYRFVTVRNAKELVKEVAKKVKKEVKLLRAIGAKVRVNATKTMAVVKVSNGEVEVEARKGRVKIAVTGNLTLAVTEANETAVKKLIGNLTLVTSPILVEPVDTGYINATVKLYFEPPAGVEPDKVIVVKVEPDGTVVKVKEFKVENGYVVVETTTLSTWALAEEVEAATPTPSPTPTPTPAPTPTEAMPMTYIIVLAVAVIVVLALVFALRVRRK